MPEVFFTLTPLIDDDSPSKADNLVSLGYTIVYLAKGCNMSWDAAFQEFSKKKTHEAHRNWYLVKAEASSDYLCSGLPVAFHTFLHSVLSLAPEVNPDYYGYIENLRSTLDDIIS